MTPSQTTKATTTETVIFDACDERAVNPSLSGGKGANTHFLLNGVSWGRRQVHVPPTLIVPTTAFAHVALAGKSLDGLLEDVDRTGSMRSADRLREEIGAIELPTSLRQELASARVRLGGVVAVRSSAITEDGRDHAAAGLATTCLNVRDDQSLRAAILTVWASLYSEAFCEYRRLHGISSRAARMAVLLQPHLVARAAGAASSIHPTGRPVYCVSAVVGGGQGVVQGEGIVDRWIVGLTAREVLEQAVRRKTVGFREIEGGGMTKVRLACDESSLSEEEVLRVAEAMRAVRQAFVRHEMAHDVDVEFLFDYGGNLHVVQARAEEGPRLQGGSSIRVRAVDISAVAPDTPRIRLEPTAIVASAGATTAPLQIVQDDDGQGHTRTRPGVILATQHTSNSWNHIFFQLAGVITSHGADTSHAAKNARRLGIPCVVGAPGALRALADMDGQVVTLDTETRAVYQGALPIREHERSLGVWVSNLDQIEAAEDERWASGLFKSFEENRTRRGPEVFREDFEGRWRRVSGPCPRFQLSYLDRAWSEMFRQLRERFHERGTVELVELPRKVCRGGLFLQFANHETISIYQYLAGLRGRSLGDFRTLIEDRYRALVQFNRRAAEVERVDAATAPRVVDALVAVYAQVHTAFWVDACLQSLYLHDQLKYIDRPFRETLRRAAARRVDPAMIRDLSERHDVELHAALERVRSAPALERAFRDLSSGTLSHFVSEHAPNLLAVVRSWGRTYSRGRWRIDRPLDVASHLRDLKQGIEGAQTPPLDLVVGEIRRRLSADEVAQLAHGVMPTGHPDLVQLVRARARAVAAGVLQSDWTTSAEPSRRDRLSAAGGRAETAHPSVLRALADAAARQQSEEDRAEDLLGEFSTLAETLRISALEMAVRDDAHHIIVGGLVHLSERLSEAQGRFAEVFDDGASIFDLTVDELPALFSEREPSYLKLSTSRGKLLDEAESALDSEWSRSPRAAVAAYRERVGAVRVLLETQARRATRTETRGCYQRETERIDARVASLSARAAGGST